MFGDLLARVCPDAAQALFLLLVDCRKIRGRILANARGVCGDASGQDSGCGALEPALNDGEALDKVFDGGSLKAASGQGMALEATPLAKVTFDVLGRQFLAKCVEVVKCPQASVWEDTAYVYTHEESGGCKQNEQQGGSKLEWVMLLSALKEYSFLSAVGGGAKLVLDNAKEATATVTFTMAGLAQSLMECSGMLAAMQTASKQPSKQVAAATASAVANKKLVKHPDISDHDPAMLLPILRNLKPGTEGAIPVVPYTALTVAEVPNSFSADKPFVVRIPEKDRVMVILEVADSATRFSSGFAGFTHTWKQVMGTSGDTV